jgi:WD40 repeat protein
VGGYTSFYSGNGRVYGAYEIDQLPNPNEVLNPGWAIPGFSGGAFVDDLSQRFISQPNSNQVRVSDLKTGAVLGTITHSAGEYFKTIAWVQHGRVAGICSSSGKVKIMDYLSGLNVVEAGRIDPHRVAAYDSAFHVLVAIGMDNKTRVYCREAWPYALSNPVFDPPTVYGLKGNTVKVRLTGQEGEPCPGWWAHWELEGVGGAPLGCLDKYVSQTDKDGWAWNLYFGPDDNAVGQTKIRTWVVLA